MKLNQLLDDLLYMTKAQRNGSVVLIIIMVLVLIFRMLIPVIFKDRTDYSQIMAQNMRMIDSIYGQQNSAKTSRTTIDTAELFVFDPNTITEDGLRKLGISAKTTRTFLNYRKSGAFFGQPQDILRVYGIDSTLYRKLEPYIQISPREKSKTVVHSDYPKYESRSPSVKNNKAISYNEKEKAFSPKPVSPVEINMADSALLTTLPGIGPVFASRICKFRNYLGGFHSTSQLLEVYNFSEETYHSIKHLLLIDTSLVKTININFCDLNELKKHPYCTYKQARAIIDYRAHAGSLHSVDQLLNDEVIDSASFKKIAPYLTIDVELTAQ